MGRTAPLTSKRCILYIYSTNVSTEYLKHALYSPFFFSSKCSLFHDANFFGSCIIHILYTDVLKLKKNNSGAKGLNWHSFQLRHIPCDSNIVKWHPRAGKQGAGNYGTNIFFNIKMKEFVSFSINFFFYLCVFLLLPFRGRVCHFWGVNWKNVNDGWRCRLFPWVNGSHPSTVNITKNVLVE